MGQPLVVFI